MADRLANMRLTAEGAVALFDQSQGNLDTLTVDLIGEALYLLRDHIQAVQESMANMICQEMEEDAGK